MVACRTVSAIRSSEWRPVASGNAVRKQTRETRPGHVTIAGNAVPGEAPLHGLKRHSGRRRRPLPARRRRAASPPANPPKGRSYRHGPVKTTCRAIHDSCRRARFFHQFVVAQLPSEAAGSRAGDLSCSVARRHRGGSAGRGRARGVPQAPGGSDLVTVIRQALRAVVKEIEACDTGLHSFVRRSGTPGMLGRFPIGTGQRVASLWNARVAASLRPAKLTAPGAGNPSSKLPRLFL
jgi:hypothetical protein